MKYRTNEKEPLNRITIKDFPIKVHKYSITDIEGLVISRGLTRHDEYVLDFEHPYILDGFIIILCSQGSGKIKINLKEYAVYKNCVIVASSNFIVQSLERSDDLQFDFVFFSFDFISDIKLHAQISDIAKTVGEQSLVTLKGNDFDDLLCMHRLIVSQSALSDDYRVSIVKSLLYAMIYKVLQSYTIQNIKESFKAKTREEEIYSQFISLIFTFYKTERSINFYADKLNLTPKYFSKMIKKVDGMSASDRIDEMVIIGAKAMLKSSSLSIAQISEELNFANPSFFGTYFKKKVGITPLEFRQH